MRQSRIFIRAGVMATLLTACAMPVDISNLNLLNGANTLDETQGCFATVQTPAVIETRIEDVMVTPAIVAADGTITSAAVFRTQTQQKIVQERQEVRIQTPCPPLMDQTFLASLQRALKARGHYQGDITAAMDSATLAAVRSFQAENGLNSEVLSLATARQLGLLV